MEEDFLEGRPQNAIPARNESDPDDSITFIYHIIADGSCLADSPTE